MNVLPLGIRFCAAEFKSDNVIPENVGLRLAGTLSVNVVDCVPVFVDPE